jgi:hypothetical protein
MTQPRPQGFLSLALGTGPSLTFPRLSSSVPGEPVRSPADASFGRSQGSQAGQVSRGVGAWRRWCRRRWCRPPGAGAARHANCPSRPQPPALEEKFSAVSSFSLQEWRRGWAMPARPGGRALPPCRHTIGDALGALSPPLEPCHPLRPCHPPACFSTSSTITFAVTDSASKAVAAVCPGTTYTLTVSSHPPGMA